MVTNCIGFRFGSPPLMALSGETIPVALISLPDQVERRTLLLERGIPEPWVANYFHAADLRRVTIADLPGYADVRRIEAVNNRPLRPAEIGCSISHRAVQRWLLTTNSNMALVLEDDVVPDDPAFVDRIVEISDRLLPHAKTGAAFVCLLGARADQVDMSWIRPVSRRSTRQRESGLLLHADPVRSLWRAHAYLVSRGAARRQDRIESKVLTLADAWNERRHLGLVDEVFFACPRILRQDEDIPSTIRPADCGGGYKFPSPRPSKAVRAMRAIKNRTFFTQLCSSLSFRKTKYLAWISSFFTYRIT